MRLLFTAALALTFAGAVQAKEKPVIAFTWDDLPAHSALPPGGTRVQIADDLLKAAAQAKAPAFGFINGAQAAPTANEPDSTPVLKMWRDAGQRHARAVRRRDRSERAAAESPDE
jgi:hypothetical protein